MLKISWARPTPGMHCDSLFRMLVNISTRSGMLGIISMRSGAVGFCSVIVIVLIYSDQSSLGLSVGETQFANLARGLCDLYGGGGLYFFAPLYEIALEFFGKRHARVQRGLGKLTSVRHARGSPGQRRAQTETEHQRQENRHGNEGDQQFYLVELQFLRRHSFLRFSRAWTTTDDAPS